MPKLYFRYGTMNSSKTMNLLMVAHNYEQQNKQVIVIKPKIDGRFGENYVASRTGFRRPANIILDVNDNILQNDFKWSSISCVLVDEAQFLQPFQIDHLREISLQVPVICYGLRTDYRSKLFPGSKRLMELADTIEEIKTICFLCPKKSIINMKFIRGRVIIEGSDEPDLGAEEKYKPVCWSCWKNMYRE